jgi:hypothetical protein
VKKPLKYPAQVRLVETGRTVAPLGGAKEERSTLKRHPHRAVAVSHGARLKDGSEIAAWLLDRVYDVGTSLFVALQL